MSDSATLPDHFKVQFNEGDCQYADMLRRMTNYVLVLVANGMFIPYIQGFFSGGTQGYAYPKHFVNLTGRK
jgi:hypothetical protein